MSLIDKITSSPERMRAFQRERLMAEITELICKVMEEEGVSRAELAGRLGKSKPYITKLLRGSANMTLGTASDVFHALGRSLRLVERPLSAWTPELLVVEVNQGQGSNRKFTVGGAPPHVRYDVRGEVPHLTPGGKDTRAA